MRFVDIVVDSNTDSTDMLYTYSCEEELPLGTKVTVPFSRGNRLIAGYVASNSDTAPVGIKGIKPVRSVEGGEGLSEEAMRTALWMRERYICRYIEAVNCFLPPYDGPARRTKNPFEDMLIIPSDPHILNEGQEKALKKIAGAIDSGIHNTFLLAGVTGSGKTEVYIRAMEEVLKEGKQGIVLVPEIALTPQTVSRFMNRFGKEAVAVLHSRLTAAQRTAAYDRIRSKAANVIIGARSAVFAPVEDLGLIVIDEEHESSYKSDMSPKYDAREVAVKRGMIFGAPVVLGSATPSIESRYRSEEGIFERIEMPERYNKVAMPKVEIVDMRREIRSGNLGIYSDLLKQEMTAVLGRGRQIILFLNRRGYAPFVSCRECGFVVKCPECNISLTFHKSKGACVCHYCGRTEKPPKVCPSCGSPRIGYRGTGTERVQEEAAKLFPSARCARLDFDTVKRKGSLEKILREFRDGKIDILIGTQMVAKGLDFHGVELVGVMDADVTLNIPDFRSPERTFQLITQVAGRSGRGDGQGKVIVQTASPDSDAIRFAKSHDVKGFYESEIVLRRAIKYPPFSDIFQISVQDEDMAIAENSASRCERWLRRKLSGEFILIGPTPFPMTKAGGMYRFQLLIKSPAGRRRECADIVREMKTAYTKVKSTAAKLITTDINPYSYL